MYGFRGYSMKRFLKILLITALLTGGGISFQGCMLFHGHGADADPYDTGLNNGFDWESFEEGNTAYSSVESLSKTTIEAVAEDLYSNVQDMIIAEGLNVGRSRFGYQSYSTFDPKNLSVSIDSDLYGSATIYGKVALVVSQIQHCAIFSNFTINYELYSYANKEEYHESKIMNGSGDIRLMATSRSCSFATGINLDLKMSGNLIVNGIKIKELEFTATFQSTSTLDIEIGEAVVDTPEGIRYCRSYSSGGIFCSAVDTRIYEYDDITACPDSIGAGHVECDLPISSLLEGIWMSSGEEIPYEVNIKCSPDGIWSPPCPLEGYFDICPYGSTCSASPNVDWGNGLENYGICTCR